MKIQNKIQVIATLLIILVSSCGIHREQNKTFFFVQITDPQFGFFSNNNGFKEEVSGEVYKHKYFPLDSVRVLK